jgi:hypothetical protein
MATRKPAPEREANPSRRDCGPDPEQLTLADLDLSDAFHSGSQVLSRLVELGFDAEEIAAVLGFRHRGAVLHLESSGSRA